ncbi:MAG: hypothetical protein CENE_02359 [Candidatus Celerinatantimonas neptuna]|nr:MAG: hypothetical protein CENE_02359 [Candidatus Celerinatantimonas neptuna]
MTDISVENQDNTITKAPMSEFHVLKDHDAFLVTNRMGDLCGNNDGLFINDTRMLSVFELFCCKSKPKLLSSAVDRDNIFLTSHMTNQSWNIPQSQQEIPQGSIYLERRHLLWDNRLLIQITIDNFSRKDLTIPFEIRFDADFKDLFEIRGEKRPQRGTHLESKVDKQSVTLNYQGLDHVHRTTSVSFSKLPQKITEKQAQFELSIPSRENWKLLCEVSQERHIANDVYFQLMSESARQSMKLKIQRGSQISCSGRLFQAWLDKAKADLSLLTSELPTGFYPYAGIPWFSTPFGRDAIITALQTIWIDPALSRGVLNYLAVHQAQETSDFYDSQPGKILHETRRGEMVATKELPFSRYYGGVDTTPLFIMLAGAYYRRTADQEFIRSIWKQLKAAGKWIKQQIQKNQLGLLCYQQGEKTGLTNQGWKDSHDSVSHADGQLAQAPIALVEVQGYCYQAFADLAELETIAGEANQAQNWKVLSEQMRQNVESRFWLDQRKFYATAIDGQGQPCQIDSSNVGHLLYVGLPSAERARDVIDKLMSPEMHSGWGIRTLSSTAARFNPMSYHNGSIWPHDVALCCAGMSHYGEQEGVRKLVQEMFEAALFFEMRLPELFCGFTRCIDEAPVSYPVACQPQSWASGAAFMMLQACLGIEIDGLNHRLNIDQPMLPDSINELTIKQLQVADSYVELNFQRMGTQTVALLDPDQAQNIPLKVTYN